MSRHRHIRNIDLDDEDDGYDDWDDDYYEEEEEAVDAEAAQYLRGNSSNSNNNHNLNSIANSAPRAQRQPQPPAENTDNDMAVSFLCEEFSRVLGCNLMTGDVKRALVETDYNQEASLAYLRDLHSKNNSGLLLETPSGIGQLVTDTTNSQRTSIPSASKKPRFVAASQQHVGPVDSVVTSGKALYPQDVNETSTAVQRFNFQDPSPDDIMEARRGRGRERAMGAKLRLPKPSGTRPSAAKSAFKALLEDPSPTQSSSVSAPASRTTNNIPRKSKTKAGKLRIPTKSEPRAPKSTLRKVADGNNNGMTAQPSQSNKEKTAVQRSKTLNVAAEAKKAVAEKSSISIVVSGHVDAGKSTLLGQLLKSLNADTLKKGKGRAKTHGDLAHILDSDELEQERGVTIDFCVREFERERKGKLTTFAMLDSPGHRDFVPAMISGATQASAAVLVVDSSTGEFESGISENGQTKEHAVLLRAVGISHLVVAINKLDTVGYDKERYEHVREEMQTFLKGIGWRNAAKFVPVAGRAGTNVIEKAGKDCKLSEWYKGPTFLETLEKLADINDTESEKRIAEEPTKPTRLLISDSFRSTSLGGVISVTGRLLLGSVAPRDTLMINPGGHLATVKNIEVNAQRVKLAIAGVHNTPVSLSLTEVPDALVLSAGDVLCDPVNQVPIVTKFRAQIVTRNPDLPLIEGSAVEVHVGGGSGAGQIRKLVELRARDGNPAQKRPRRLVKGDTAIVEVKLDRAMCMEKSAYMKNLGFFTLRARGRSVAVGIVLDILKEKGKSSKKKSGKNGE